MTRLEEIDLELKELDKIIELKESVWDNSKPWEEYNEYLRPENRKISELGRERRMIMPYELDEMPKYGDVMSLEVFIGCVEAGLFINYDGYGHYCKDGMETNIEIYPSDIKHKMIRKEFDTIVWFNR